MKRGPGRSARPRRQCRNTEMGKYKNRLGMFVQGDHHDYVAVAIENQPAVISVGMAV